MWSGEYLFIKHYIETYYIDYRLRVKQGPRLAGVERGISVCRSRDAEIPASRGGPDIPTGEPRFVIRHGSFVILRFAYKGSASSVQGSVFGCQA